MAAAFTDTGWQGDVLDASGLVMVDFWADWCGPCHMLAPTVEEIADEMGNKIKVGKLNVDENQATAAKYQVMSIPTVMIFKDGEVVEKLIGVQPKQAYVDAINRHA
ncbi:thioredoxin [Candidatus Dojkabacteria bacterium]|uniref:Thioredoxin n=1 Tax=Candidatus Dojkabacteria bacterium TaxID=2099670 RepID=A0A955HZQ9_9BACT|nr:thioredoxin [Candidatus Dojkabacteria bacterium]MCB9790457.1 thioredoxin [Candidatus Nomurabacteria bacterium]